MLLTAVFASNTTGTITVRSHELELTLNDFPTMAFCKPEEIVREKAFKSHVVKLMLQKFPHQLHDIHTVIVSLNDKVIRRWRSNRGHFKEVE